MYFNSPFTIRLSINEQGKIWSGINSSTDLKQGQRQIIITDPGSYKLYYKAEDLVGNTIRLDSARFILDMSPPEISIEPEPGKYSSEIKLKLTADEPCRFYRHRQKDGADRIKADTSFTVDNRFTGYITGVDKAGNSATTSLLEYIIDTSSVSVYVEPAPGIYNSMIECTFKKTEGSEVFYSLNPAAPLKWFKEYKKPVSVPYGLSMVRFYAENKFGARSEVKKAGYVIDTIAPELKVFCREGSEKDTVTLYTKERSIITYSFEPQASLEYDTVYTEPLIIPRKNKAFIKAIARDSAGNKSETLWWEKRYDKTPPEIKASHSSGTYLDPITLKFRTNEPADIFYTLDGTEVSETSRKYTPEGIRISRGGKTTIKFFARDRADNFSEPESLTIDIDVDPPDIMTFISETPDKDTYEITMSADEESDIFYTLDGSDPDRASEKYTSSIEMKTGEILKYFGIDRAGNRSKIQKMTELKEPSVSITPDPGVYSGKIMVAFKTRLPASIYYRLLPDSVFSSVDDSLTLSSEGLHRLEYYFVTESGIKSPLRSVKYVIDRTPPSIDLSIRRGTGDSVSIFFEASENATIYYTTDGTSALSNQNVNVAGNKYYRNSARISLIRNRETTLSFIAEDIAGNLSSETSIDIFKPVPVPNIPASAEKVYNRILSVDFNTYDERSRIYYERGGIEPNLQSDIFEKPLTLLATDTIKAFVVDPSGYRGETETFIYRIDLPPSSHFVTDPDTGFQNREMEFNASNTIDKESPFKELVFKWDFDNDGQIDKSVSGYPKTTHTYSSPGRFTAVLYTTDPMGRTDTLKRDVLIRGRCPKGMVFIPRRDGNSFCIDRFEWPNQKDAVPKGGISWIEAQMICMDEGKRLCTLEEWRYVCGGGRQDEVYPYGTNYISGKCPVEERAPLPSGSRPECGEGFGVRDMVGNLWEWVADKEGKNRVITGGGYNSGLTGHCQVNTVGGPAEKMENTGFRCCR